ncbi:MULTISPECIES: hypothetical protein [unclassified Brevibacterium]|uniref:hypothetical protein n=1 Tax=unclassified Brevibacterium TaxID=2614124 RepID=UPI0008A164C5|nr:MULTISPECIES: hypothetical protein [unclassified Brevibacterium]OFL68577.1 hypothetical protein HMPREF2757_08030 [Brevibacterium sp. HMSC063G07]
MDFSRAFPAATTLSVPRELLADVRDAGIARLLAGEIDEAEYESDMRAARLSAYRQLADDGLYEPHAIPADFAHGSLLVSTAIVLGLIGGSSSHVSLRAELDLEPPAGLTGAAAPSAGPVRPGRLFDLRAEAFDEEGVEIRPVLAGPASVLRAFAGGLADDAAGQAWVDVLTNAYSEVLRLMAADGTVWVQIDERQPALGEVDSPVSGADQLGRRVWENIAVLEADVARPRIFAVGAPQGTAVEAVLVETAEQADACGEAKAVLDLGNDPRAATAALIAAGAQFRTAVAGTAEEARAAVLRLVMG